MKAILLAAAALSASTTVLASATPPKLPGPEAMPREIVDYLVVSDDGYLSDPTSEGGRRLMSSSLIEKYERQWRVVRWTADHEDSVGNVVTCSQDNTFFVRVTEDSPTSITAHFVDEAKIPCRTTFEFAREGTVWKVSDVAWGRDPGDRLSAFLDKIAAKKLPGRLEFASAYDVDLAKGRFNGEAGTSYDHNGSDVIVFPRAGMVFFERPKAAISAAVKPSDLLFTGTFKDGRVDGIAYTFKAGCNPAPYEVKGTYKTEGYGGANEIVLAGAAPVADRKSCAILGYSTKSSNARLRFTFTQGDM